MFGVTLLGLGFAVILIDLYRTDLSNPVLLVFLSYGNLKVYPSRLARSPLWRIRYWRHRLWYLAAKPLIVKPFIRPGSDVFDQLAEFRRRERGPRIVAIGGGHGIFHSATRIKHTPVISQQLSLLRMMAAHPGDCVKVLAFCLRGIFAIVLRLYPMTKPCLRNSFNIALAALLTLTVIRSETYLSPPWQISPEVLKQQLLNRGRVLSVNGRVLPSTLHDVKLVASMELPHSNNEVRVEGESKIPRNGRACPPCLA